MQKKSTFRRCIVFDQLAEDLLKNLRNNLASKAVEVATINDEQFLIRRKSNSIIEIVATIPQKIDDLRAKLTNSLFDTCCIDGRQKVIKRDRPNLIEILADIVPIEEAATSLASNIAANDTCHVSPHDINSDERHSSESPGKTNDLDPPTMTLKQNTIFEVAASLAPDSNINRETSSNIATTSSALDHPNGTCHVSSPDINTEEGNSSKISEKPNDLDRPTMTLKQQTFLSKSTQTNRYFFHFPIV